MADYIDFDKLIGKEISPDLLAQLQVLGRVKFQPKPTTASAVSTSAQEQDSQPEVDDLDNLINSVDEFEKTVEELEDMADQLLKDMNISPANDSIAVAARALNSDGLSNITKDTLDTALAIMDYFPIMMLGQDPVLGGMTGEGRLEGPYLQCSQITKNTSTLFKKVSEKNIDNISQPIKDSATETIEQHEKQKSKMIAEIILQMLWNIIWVKATVDMGIINPTRVIVANPVDTLITFFMKIKKAGKSPLGTEYPEKNRFKKPEKGHLETFGPINKIVNNVRLKLLCLPKLFWNRYQPPEDPITGKPVNCKFLKCDPPPPNATFKEDSEKLSEVDNMLQDTFSDTGCVGMEDLVNKFEQQFQPTGLGMPPECAKYAQTVIDAVIADALTPNDSSPVVTQLQNQLSTLETI